MSPAAPLHARPLRLSTQEAGFEAAFAQRLHWSAEEDAAVESRVRAILLDVRARGDAALLQYTRALDRVEAHSVQALQIAPEEMQAAFEALSHKQKSALQAAAQRVRCYHEAQKNACCQGWSYREADGSVLGQTVTPLESVGVYVPGGKAAYPSSVLMNAIPARVAGVAEIIMAVPTPGGEKNRMVLAAAHLAGVTRGFCMGGAQAVAALAFGTESVPKVDKITGPGNAYVASAKKQVFGQVGIDMIAGPSEILILADGSVPPDWVAMDLFAQAEHDELAQSILLCPDAAYLDAVQQAMERLLPEMPRQAIISKSLNARGALIHTRDLAEACGIANRIAPEHLEIACAEPEQWQPHLRHAGAIFVGAYASESLGDYCAGPNHVLPTSGTARFSSPLGVYDFQKRSSVLHISQQAAQTLGPVAATLALEEGLQAHAHAARMRTSDYTPFTQGAARVRHDLDAVLARLASLRDEWSGTPPDEALLDAHENTLGLKLHADVRHFFKTLGEVSFGALDNLSAQRKWREEDAHCQLITTNLEARQMGVPPSWLVLVEDNSNYFCVKPDGRVSYWAHDSEMEEEEWENLATWIDEVWIEEGLAGENDEE